MPRRPLPLLSFSAAALALLGGCPTPVLDFVPQHDEGELPDEPVLTGDDDDSAGDDDDSSTGGDCVPDCGDRECGDDGCDGSCGECTEPPEDVCVADTVLQTWTSPVCNEGSGQCDWDPVTVGCDEICDQGACTVVETEIPASGLGLGAPLQIDGFGEEHFYFVVPFALTLGAQVSIQTGDFHTDQDLFVSDQAPLVGCTELLNGPIEQLPPADPPWSRRTGNSNEDVTMLFERPAGQMFHATVCNRSAGVGAYSIDWEAE